MNETDTIRRFFPDLEIREKADRTENHIRYLTVNGQKRKQLMDVIRIPAQKAAPDHFGEATFVMNPGFTGMGNGDSPITLQGCLDQIERIRKACADPSSCLLPIEEYKVVPDGFTGGKLLIVFLEGLPSLASVSAGGYLFSEVQIIQAGADLCDALQAAEDSGIIRDKLYPGSIYVKNGRYLFGSYRYTEYAGTGQVGAGSIGPMLYQAPEVLRGRNSDLRGDLFALSMVLYELANRGRLPFIDTPASLLSERETEKAVAERLLNKGRIKEPCGVDLGLGKAILRGLSQMSTARYRTPARMKEAVYGVSVSEARIDETVVLPPTADLEETMVLPQEHASLEDGTVKDPFLPAAGSRQTLSGAGRESDGETGPGEEGTAFLSGLSFEDGTTVPGRLSDEDRTTQLQGLSGEDGTTILQGLSFEDETTVLEGLSDEDRTTLLQRDSEEGGEDLQEEDQIQELDLPADDFDRTFMPGGLRGLYSRGIHDPEAIKKVLDEKKRPREEVSGQALSGRDFDRFLQELDAIKQMLQQVAEQNAEILANLRHK
jgi:hypothetical protein